MTTKALMMVMLLHGNALMMNAFQLHPLSRSFSSTRQRHMATTDSDTTTTTTEGASSAQRLLDRAAQLRAEIAAAEGKTLEEVQQEAQVKKQQQLQQEQRMAELKKERKESLKNTSADAGRSFVQVPNTFDDMVRQAARAVERAFTDGGMTRQTVRFNLITEDQPAAWDENEWPGGARQIYREAGKPLTDALLREIRAPTENLNEINEQRRLAPTLKSQDIWDFDGSALHTAEAAEGASADIQALVFANTDTKYLDDIEEISEALGKKRLFLLVNPFWRNIDSWSFNLLAPGAKKRAQKVIFDQGGYTETYSMLIFSVRGEKCAAIKAYPYDWQLFAFREDDYNYRNEDVVIRLGSCQEEPTSALITQLLNQRPEFKDTRTMRQMKKNMQG